MGITLTPDRERVSLTGDERRGLAIGFGLDSGFEPVHCVPLLVHSQRDLLAKV